jgi:hypothetical protein
MDQRISDCVKSTPDEDQAERSIEEFEQLSGQGPFLACSRYPGLATRDYFPALAILTPRELAA